MQLYTSTYPMAYNMQYRQYCFAGHSILCTSYNIPVNSVHNDVVANESTLRAAAALMVMEDYYDDQGPMSGAVMTPDMDRMRVER